MSLDKIMEVFRQKEAEKRPKRYDSLHFRYQPMEKPKTIMNRNEDMEISVSTSALKDMDDSCSYDDVSLEVFCNPNMHSSAFNAIALVTVCMKSASGGEMRFVTECGLSTLKTDVEDFLSQ